MIVVPAFAWRMVIDAFAGAPAVVERVAFLDGVPAGPKVSDGGAVTTVTFPQARETEGEWEVPSTEMSGAGRHLRPYGLVRLAQVHTHPGPWTGHSEIDDMRAFSHEPGAISVVLPSHALTCPGLADAGVHLREPGHWRQLGPDEIGGYVRIVPSVVDRRPRS